MLIRSRDMRIAKIVVMVAVACGGGNQAAEPSGSGAVAAGSGSASARAGSGSAPTLELEVMRSSNPAMPIAFPGNKVPKLPAMSADGKLIAAWYGIGPGVMETAVVLMRMNDANMREYFEIFDEKIAAVVSQSQQDKKPIPADVENQLKAR
jgi:hypothetical protein